MTELRRQPPERRFQIEGGDEWIAIDRGTLSRDAVYVNDCRGVSPEVAERAARLLDPDPLTIGEELLPTDPGARRIWTAGYLVGHGTRRAFARRHFAELLLAIAAGVVIGFVLAGGPVVSAWDCPNCCHWHQHGAVCGARYATNNGTPWRPCPCRERRRKPRGAER